MLKIGLTGGIGSGKTTVCQLFASYGVPIIDADDIAHELVKPGMPALQAIEAAFGAEYIQADGWLNRSKVRDVIFTDDSAKQRLEAILHPLVYSTIQAKLSQLQAPYCIICVPLLFETNMAHIADRILVVDCPVTQQVERVKKRANMAVEKIQAIIDSQISREMRIAKADDLINNAAQETDLVSQVSALHDLFISLSTTG